jgi:hypothetical protein
MFNPKSTEWENVTAALLTKSADWLYELERRIIDHEVVKVPRRFPRNC